MSTSITLCVSYVDSSGYITYGVIVDGVLARQFDTRGEALTFIVDTVNEEDKNVR